MMMMKAMTTITFPTNRKSSRKKTSWKNFVEANLGPETVIVNQRFQAHKDRQLKRVTQNLVKVQLETHQKVVSSLNQDIKSSGNLP